MTLQQFISSKALVNSNTVSKSSIIFGKSNIGNNTIIDPSVIIGYPIRSKIQELMTKTSKSSSIEQLYDEASLGSVIGEKCHLRSFTTIYESTELSDRVETGTNVIIREKVKIGSGSIIGSGTVVDGDVLIGKNARIQSLNFIPPKVVIGNNVFIGPGVRFSNDLYPVSQRLIKTEVKDNVVIGISAVILPGIVIGERSVIAAGTLVTKSVPENVVMMGSPAKQVMTREEYDLKLEEYEELLE